jgi:AbrB family looped-hinge helix DNA binding protein
VKALVTSKGQVTIPKELCDRFGIEPGAQVDFCGDLGRDSTSQSHRKQMKVLGCLKTELVGRSVDELLDELRGPVELPSGRQT